MSSLPTQQKSPHRYNEALRAPDSVKPMWQQLQSELSDGSYDRLSSLLQLSEHLLREDGASYNVHGDPDGTTRNWPLDVVPFLLAQEQWQALESGIRERAHLFNLMLQDIYGEQHLIRQGVIPPQLIFSHPGYARPWVGMATPDNCSLGMYAVDLVRASDGEFYAVGDRTQIPSGSGYALENRVVMTRVLPQMYRDSHVARLAHYFSDLRDLLTRLGSAQSNNPRIVLLSAGSQNETYFEQEFIANYLGISLVEGQDLFVRKGMVWLRSLYGDEKVDVILRRVDDDFCDPLEFRGDSLLGISGLTEAARRGNVRIINPLGSGVLEHPALRAYLPAIAEYFGEPAPSLKHPQIWWCGIESQRRYVESHFDQLVMKRYDRGKTTRAVIVDKLDAAQREHLYEQVQTAPEQWVAEERLLLSIAPTVAANQIADRSIVLRGFAVRGENGYSVMPGGLTRVSATPDNDLISNQVGSLSKDTWIVSGGKDEANKLWLHPQHKLNDAAPENLVHGRSAENLFWMGRYTGRVDMQLNLLRQLGRRLGSSGNKLTSPATVDQVMLLKVLTEFSRTYPGFTNETKLRDPQARHSELHEFCTDTNHTGGYAYNLYYLVFSGKKIQGVLSSESRRVLSQLEFELSSLCNISEEDFDIQSYLFTHHKDQLLALHSLTGQSMIRGLAWRFLDVGRCFEGALAMLRLLDTLLSGEHHDVDDYSALYLLLTSADNDVNFLQRYASEVSADRVLDLLLLEPNNPNSVASHLRVLLEHLEEMPAKATERSQRPEERLVNDAMTRLRLGYSLELSEINAETGRRDNLKQLLDSVQELLRDAAQHLAIHYFTRTVEQQQSLSPIIK